MNASPVVLSTMLVHYHEKKPRERVLKLIEQRYKSQLEREALAVVWVCEYLYVYVAPVKVLTDHKPLGTLYGNPGATAIGEIG